MDGTVELLQLAHLLRVGANTARDLAALRKANVKEICSIAAQAETLADDLEKIVTASVVGRSISVRTDH